MKQLSVIFYLTLISYSCNGKPKETKQAEVIKDTIDTTKTIKEAPADITKAFILGKFDYKNDSTFVKISRVLSSKDIYLKADTYDAFLNMKDSANKAGIEFKIISGTRNFYEQKVIWERKWRKYKNLRPKERALKILEYSSMPSSSRHHWGTDIDLNSLNNSYFNSGKGLAEYNWLIANAHHFGFYQVYTDKNSGRTGYNLEKWHWSYLPLASAYLEFYNNSIDCEDINDFDGSELARELKIIEDYVNGISDKAKNYK